MNAKIISSIIVLLMVIVSLGTVVSMVEKVESSEAFDYVTGEVIVGFTDSIDVKEFKLGDLDPVLSNEIIQIVEGINMVVVGITKGQEEKFIDLYEKSDDVLYAEKNGILHKSSYDPPKDSGWGQQYGPESIGCLDAWDTSISGSVTIAIVDTGIWYNEDEDRVHEDLAGHYIGGRNIIDNNDEPWDYDSHHHGTHCAGIAAASVNNDVSVITGKAVGIAGVAGPDSDSDENAANNFNINLLAVKVLGPGGGTAADVADGIDYASDNADVISMSLGHTGSSYSSIEQACINAWDSGDILVAAAGNGGPDGVGDDTDLPQNQHYPSNYPCVISVAAIDSNDNRARFSNYGNETVDFAAPGVDIYSCSKDDGYRYLSGTSMACPHVAGVAALAMAKYPGKTNQQIRDLLEMRATNISQEDRWIHGKINADLGEEPEPPSELKIEITTDKIQALDPIDMDPDNVFYGAWVDFLELIGMDNVDDTLAPEWVYQVIVDDKLEQVSYDFANSQRIHGDSSDVGFCYYLEKWRSNVEDTKTWYDIGTCEVDVDDADNQVEFGILLFDADMFLHDIADISSDDNYPLLGDTPYWLGGNSHLGISGRMFDCVYDYVNDTIITELSDEYTTSGNWYITRGDWDGSTDEDDPEGGWDVTDHAQDDALVKFKIIDNCIPPEPNIDVSSSSVRIKGQEVQFLGSVESSTGWGSIDTWEWDFGDGSTSSSQSPTHTYNEDFSEDSKTYDVTLTVTDSKGQIGTDSYRITIEKNKAPGTPSVNGPNGEYGETKTYTANAADSNSGVGDKVKYKYELIWNDETEDSGETSYYKPGTNVEFDITFPSVNVEFDRTMTVRAKAIDLSGSEGEWGTKSVTVPKAKAKDHSNTRLIESSMITERIISILNNLGKISHPLNVLIELLMENISI